MVQQRRRRQDQRQERRPQDVPEVVWKPVTELGKKVHAGTITDIQDIFNSGQNIQEAEIVTALLPNLEEDLLLIGQAKGKFGGGQRRIFRQTQKKTREGNKIHFMTCALVGNRNGFVGVGTGKSKETVPARDKSKRRARLNLMMIRRGCGSWECNCKEGHSVPFTVMGGCGSSRIELIPAPKGKGLCVEKECAKILAFAGIKDVWSKTYGQTKTKLNLIQACLDALRNLSKIKVKPEDYQNLGIVDGRLAEVEKVDSLSSSKVAKVILTPEEISKESESAEEESIEDSESDDTEENNAKE
jgi:small subunit ribosomal protein S5